MRYTRAMLNYAVSKGRMTPASSTLEPPVQYSATACAILSCKVGHYHKAGMKVTLTKPQNACAMPWFHMRGNVQAAASGTPTALNAHVRFSMMSGSSAVQNLHRTAVWGTPIHWWCRQTAAFLSCSIDLVPRPTLCKFADVGHAVLRKCCVPCGPCSGGYVPVCQAGQDQQQIPQPQPPSKLTVVQQREDTNT